MVILSSHKVAKYLLRIILKSEYKYFPLELENIEIIYSLKLKKHSEWKLIKPRMNLLNVELLKNWIKKKKKNDFSPR